MYKVLHNNMVIDLLKSVQYVRYMKNSKRWMGTESLSAHGIMGSDNNTIYKLRGRNCSYPGELKEVDIFPISEEEYDSLAIQYAVQREENESLRNEIKDLREQLNEQSALLQQILAKL